MLLLGALFALFGAGFWLCCLADVALTPSSECRGLPKAAWIALVAATFVAGAVIWLAFRRPARLAVSRAPSGVDTQHRSPQAPERHDPFLPGGPRGPHARDSPGTTQQEPGTIRSEPGVRSGPGEVRNGLDAAGGGPDRADGDPGGGWEGQEMSGRLEAEAALLRRPAGRSRPRGASSQARPMGPDDDPDFLRSLKRVSHGNETGGDAGGPGRPTGPAGPSSPPGPAGWRSDEF